MAEKMIRTASTTFRASAQRTARCARAAAVACLVAIAVAAPVSADSDGVPNGRAWGQLDGNEWTVAPSDRVGATPDGNEWTY